MIGTLRLVTIALAALAAAPLATAAAPGGDLVSLGDEREYVPGQVVVQFEPTSPTAARTAALASVDSDGVDRLGSARFVLVDLASGETVADAVAQLEDEPGVRSVSPNWIYHLDAAPAPNDARFGELWGLNNTGQTVGGIAGTADADMDVLEAWGFETGDATVRVGVIDSGVAYDHPDLAPRIYLNPGESGGGKETNGVDDDGNGFIDDVRGWDFVQDDNDPRDYNGHGTHVAGTIGAAANDAYGVSGVAQDLRIVPIRAFDANGSGTLARILGAINYAKTIGARIVNGSFGGGTRPDTTERDAIASATSILWFFSAGNSAEDNDVPANASFPCAHPVSNIVCVAALNNNDQLADFSNFGLTTVDVGAPGVDVLSDRPAYGAPVFADDFEGGFPGTKWTTGGTNDTWGTTTSAAASPSNSLADSPGGLYAPDTDSFARSQSFDLAGQQGCRLFYNLRLESESGFDGLFVERSGDGTTFTPIRSLSGTTNGQFVAFDHDLSPLDGDSSAFIRFRFVSDNLLQFDGAYLDDVQVRCLTSTYDADDFQFLDGTSMASPHVAGVAALLLAANPTFTTAQIRDAILGSVDPVAALAGKVATAGRVNAAKALDSVAPVAPGLTASLVGSAIQAQWSGASDATSGLAGYSVVFDSVATTTPDLTLELDGAATGTTSAPLAPGTYFVHVVAVDRVDNASAPVHAGPLTIAAPPPPPPPPPPPAPPAPLLPPKAALATISGGLTLRRKAKLGMRLACNRLATGSCRVTVTLTALVRKKGKTKRVRIGGATATVSPGKSKTIAVTANRAGKALLAAGPVRLEVKLVSTDGSGARRRLTRVFRIGS